MSIVVKDNIPASAVSRQELSEHWSVFSQAIYWAYLSCVATNFQFFSSGVDAFAIRDSGGSSVTQIAFVTMFLLSIFNYLIFKSRCDRNLKIFMPVLIPILLGFFFLFVSSVLSPNADVATRKLALLYISNFSFIFIILSVPNPRSLLSSTFVFLSAWMVVSMAGIFFYPIGAVHQDGLYEGAWRGLAGHKNYAGAILSIYIILIAMYMNKKNCFFVFPMLIMASTFIIQTESKTAMAGLILSFFVVWFASSQKILWQMRDFKYFLVIFFSFMNISFFIFGPTLFSLLGIDTDLTGRFPLWSLVLSVMDRPLIGYGYDAFFNLGTASPLYLTGGSWSRFASHAHNGYLNIYVFGGLPAIVCVLYFYLRSIDLGIRTSIISRSARFPLTIVVFETIRNVTEVDAFTSSRLTWSLTVVAAFMIMMIYSEASNSRTEYYFR